MISKYVHIGMTSGSGSKKGPMSNNGTYSTSPRPLKALSLFTGAGGMDIGLERAGFSPLIFLDNDSAVQSAIRINRPAWSLWSDGDVVAASKTLGPKDIGLAEGELDLISAAPPCQPFSAAAQWASEGRRGMGDKRSNTVHALLNVVSSFLPRVVLLENVQGFVRGNNSGLPTIEKHLQRLQQQTNVKYDLNVRILNAADFGVPQNRRRAIVVITRGDVERKWEWPEPMHRDNPMTAWDALSDLHEEVLPIAHGAWTDLLPSIPEGWNYQWFTSKGGGAELFGYRTRYWSFLLKLAKGKPAWTLAATPGPAAGPFHWENRPLSPREQLRLQSFPDGWLLEGDLRVQTRLIGNATPPLLAEILGMEVRRILGYDPSSECPTLLMQRTNLPTYPSEILPLPDRFRYMVGTKAAHQGSGRGPSPRPVVSESRK